MDNETAKSTLNALLKQAQTLFTFVYLTMVGSGMLYYHQKYSEFGINIFQYADILHFLVAPFEDIYIFAFSAVAVVLFCTGYYMDGYLRRMHPKAYTILNFGIDKKPWFRRYQLVTWPLTFVLVLYLYSDIYGERSKRVVLSGPDTLIHFDGGDSLSGKMIGKTKDIMFMVIGDQVQAIPLNTLVKKIIIPTEPVSLPKPEAPQQP